MYHNPPVSKLWFITGASSGVGRALAETVLGMGHKLVAAARDVQALGALHEAFPDQLLHVRLDLTDGDSIASAVDAATRRFGAIDVLVNNAGFGQFGAIEEVSDAEMRTQFETNVFGMLALTRAIIPGMRERRSGHVLNMSSVTGRMGMPGLGAYCGTKFAIEGISEALVGELAAFDVRVTIIELAAFRTNFEGVSMKKSTPIPAYDFIRRDWAQVFATGQYGDLAQATQAMVALTEMPLPPLRLALGPNAVAIVTEKLRHDLECYARQPFCDHGVFEDAAQ